MYHPWQQYYSSRPPCVASAIAPAPRHLAGKIMDVSHSDKGIPSEDGVAEKLVGDNCPIAKNAAALEELDAAEGRVAELLEVAAEALEELAGVESLDSSKVEASTKQFLRLVSSVHGTLSSNAALIRDYTPYPRSIYGPRKELELLHEKARFLRATLANLACEETAADSPPASGIEGATTAIAVAADPTS